MDKLDFTDSFELRMLDASMIPFSEKIIKTKNYNKVIDWLDTGKIKGVSLPASAALYGLVMALASYKTDNKKNIEIHLNSVAGNFKSTGYLNQILIHALDTCVKHMKKILDEDSADPVEEILQFADKFFDEDAEMNNKIAVNSLNLFPESSTILTSGNWGDYSSCGAGTAHSAIKLAAKSAKNVYVYICETRPDFTGSKLAAYDMSKNGVEFEIIPDSNAAVLLKDRVPDFVLAGAYKCAMNGDILTEPGTLDLAVLCSHFKIPFYAALQGSVLDFSMTDLNSISIPENDHTVIYGIDETQITRKEYNMYNPAFDVIPGELINAIISENKVHFPPFNFDSLKHLFRSYINNLE